MSNVLFKCKVDFTHGAYSFPRAGASAVVPEHIAKEWQDKGLGIIQAKPRMANKMLPDSLGNAGGPDASSASSRQGPASTSTTSNQSGSGRLSLPKKGA